MEITKASHAGTSSCAWPLLNSHIERASEISNRACGRPSRKCITWASVEKSPANPGPRQLSAGLAYGVSTHFAQVLIKQARELYINDSFGIELDQTTYALDSTTIDLCLSLFPWAEFRKRKGAVKLHTLLDLRGSIPTMVFITHGKIHEVNIPRRGPEAGAVYIMDRGYLGFARLYKVHQSAAFFLTRAKGNFRFRRLCSQAIDKSTGLQCDQAVSLVGFMPERIIRKDSGASASTMPNKTRAHLPDQQLLYYPLDPHMAGKLLYYLRVERLFLRQFLSLPFQTQLKIQLNRLKPHHMMVSLLENCIQPRFPVPDFHIIKP